MTQPRKDQQLAAALAYVHARKAQFLDELKVFSAIPSISTDPAAKPSMQQAAEWLAGYLRSLGMTRAEVMPTSGHPVVYAELLAAGPQAPTVLVYGHYDVQPAEPLELWNSPAFEPTVRGENIYARGVTDMKGQVMAAVHAVEALVRTGGLPINVKFLVEGEEEIGSPSLPAFLKEHAGLLACDLALNPDTGTLAPDLPTITYALRGLAYFEIRLHGPDHDLHSGVFGGVVHNPAQALCELIAGMHDAQGQITLPGFYDHVLPLSAQEREELSRIPTGEAYYLRETGAPAVWGEAGYTPTERVGARPTLEVNGLLSGFTGEGSKTVLPSWAMAKVSMRLVPNQDPEEVHQQLMAYLQAQVPNTIRWEVKQMAGSPASLSARDSVGVQALSKAMQSVWGKKPLFKREGGSVPVVTHFRQFLGVETVNTGFAMPGDNMHGPNEKMHIPTWYNGIDTFIHFMLNLAKE